MSKISLRPHDDPDRVTSTGTYLLALDYYAAAMGADETLGEGGDYGFNAPTPVVYLIGHAIELTLKAYVREQTGCPIEMRKSQHDLMKGLARAEGLRLCDHVELTDEERNLLGILNEHYSSKDFEYHVNGTKHVVVFGHLYPIAEKLLLGVAGAVPHARSFIERKAAGNVLRQYTC